MGAGVVDEMEVWACLWRKVDACVQAHTHPVRRQSYYTLPKPN